MERRLVVLLGSRWYPRLAQQASRGSASSSSSSDHSASEGGRQEQPPGHCGDDAVPLALSTEPSMSASLTQEQLRFTKAWLDRRPLMRSSSIWTSLSLARPRAARRLQSR